MLKPEDTLHILDSPGGCWYITEPQTQVQLCILPNGLPITKDELCFEFKNGCYVFASPSGFTSNNEHLAWLISQGKIPMIEIGRIFGKERKIILGYVEFVRQ